MGTRRKVTVVLLICLVLLGMAATALAVEIVFFNGHKNGRVTGYDQIDLEIFRAEPMKPRYYTENWFHEMQFPDKDIIVIVNFQLHNLGINRGNCFTYITYSDPESGLLHNKSFQSSEKTKIDSDGFGISCGDSSIKLEGDRYRIKYRGDDIHADLTYKILVPSFQQGDGIMRFTKSGDFVLENFPIPWVEVKGTVTRNKKTQKLNGYGSMNHGRGVLSPSMFITKWRGFWFYSDQYTINILRSSSDAMEDQWGQRLMVAERGKVLFSSHDYKFEDLDIQPVEGSTLACPRRFRVAAVHGDDFLKGEIRVRWPIQEKRNIYEDFPGWLQNIARLFVKEVWIYRFWVDYDFVFHMDGVSRKIKGKGVGNVNGPVRQDKK